MNFVLHSKKPIRISENRQRYALSIFMAYLGHSYVDAMKVSVIPTRLSSMALCFQENGKQSTLQETCNI